MLPEVGPYFWTGTGKFSSANSGNLPSATTQDRWYQTGCGSDRLKALHK
jgi:hypothetical protein